MVFSNEKAVSLELLLNKLICAPLACGVCSGAAPASRPGGLQHCCRFPVVACFLFFCSRFNSFTLQRLYIGILYDTYILLFRTNN
jgi:hypothetical protein